VSRRSFRICIGILLTLFCTVILFRNTIRAHYWATRLAASEDIASQGYYLACLASLSETAHGAVQRLAHDPRPNVRALAVYALQRLQPNSGINGLNTLLADADDAVRESAATALVFNGRPEAVSALCEAARSDDAKTAAAAVSALGRIEATPALRTLCATVRSHSDAYVRAQAVEALMDVILTGDGRWANAFPTPGAATQPEQSCDPLDILVNALGDSGTFSGLPSLERQKHGAERFAGASSRPSAAGTRTVREFAAACLSTLTGKPVDSSGPWSEERKRATVEQCRQWIATRNSR